MPMLTPAQCEAAVSEAEAHAATVGGWQTDRHISYATTDIPIRKLPRLEALWNTSLFPAIEAEARTRLGLGAGSRVLPLDVFVVKYSANEPSGQRELAIHRDNGVLTFSLLLNEPSAFGGGGTYFESSGRVYRPSRGVGVLHSALVRHAGYPIHRGVRYVLVGFCGLSSPYLIPGFEEWRFGENPAWFVSSSVVSDAQILRRVWPAGKLTAGFDDESELEDGSSYSGIMLEDSSLSTSADASGRDLPQISGQVSASRAPEASGDEHFAGTTGELAIDATAGEPIDLALAGGETVDTLTAGAQSHTTDGEKPWYRAQHELAAEARLYGELLERVPHAHGELTFELWRNGDELAALFVTSDTHSQQDSKQGATDEVAGSIVFRPGPFPPPVRRLLESVLPPPPARRRGDAIRTWLRRRLRGVGRLMGVVHVYMMPAWRGSEAGAQLTRLSIGALHQRLGVTHVLTLADDRGSGKLRAWYEALGFVDASLFTETGMVARAETGAGRN